MNTPIMNTFLGHKYCLLKEIRYDKSWKWTPLKREHLAGPQGLHFLEILLYLLYSIYLVLAIQTPINNNNASNTSNNNNNITTLPTTTTTTTTTTTNPGKFTILFTLSSLPICMRVSNTPIQNDSSRLGSWMFREWNESNVYGN